MISPITDKRRMIRLATNPGPVFAHYREQDKNCVFCRRRITKHISWTGLFWAETGQPLSTEEMMEVLHQLPVLYCRYTQRRLMDTAFDYQP